MHKVKRKPWDGIEDDPRFVQQPGGSCDQLLPWLYITGQQEWQGGEAVYS